MTERQIHLYALCRVAVPPPWRLRSAITHRALGQIGVLATDGGRWRQATFPGEPDEQRDAAIAEALGAKCGGGSP